MSHVWFRLALLAAGVALVGVAGRRRSYLLGVPAAALALLALGGLAVPAGIAWWLAVLGGVALLAVAGALLIAGAWNKVAALGALGVTALGLGGLFLKDVETTVADFALSASEMRLRSPWWLALLGTVPVVIWLGYRRLNRHEYRPWVALGLRSLGVAVLSFALAEPFFAQATRAMTVLFVVDRSLSIPEEPGEDPAQPGVRADLRTRRVLKFINDAARSRTGPERDRVGLVLFGKRPRLELPPGEASSRFGIKELTPIDDPNYTDIGAALKLALASFPEGSGRRIVLVSDGNENLGSAEEQARVAKTLGVQIDVLPLAAGRRNTDEVLVERVDAPAVIEQGARVPIRVLVRSHNPLPVVGRLTLKQITDKEGVVTLRLDKIGGIGADVEALDAPLTGVRITKLIDGGPAARAGMETGEDITRVEDAAVRDAAELAAALAKKKEGVVRLTVRRNPVKVVGVLDPARLRLGLNPFSFDRQQSDEQRSYTYEAEFEPRGVEQPDGKITPGLPGDRVQNNRASTHVVARGQGRILLLENKAGDHADLVERLVAAGKNRFKVIAEPIDVLENYRQRDQLAVFLSNFDCVILANVPADRVSEDHMEVIRSNTHDQGCGLVMIGGPESFGAGGWQNTSVEKALPVDCDLKSLKVQGKGGLVLIMHASEMADGNRWQKKIAKLAVERLGPADEVGVIDFDFNCKWHVPMTEAGPNRAKILAEIDKMTPGDMPDFDPALKLGFDALTDPKKDFGAKHIIIISDGDPVQRDKALLKKIKAAKVTIATVGVATHGPALDQSMEEIATEMPGEGRKKRYYKVTDPTKLPAIYIKETRLISQAFVHKKEFLPVLRFRTEPIRQLPDLLPLGGFVRTTPKPSPLVEVPIQSPRINDQDFPVLAHWHYGLGKGVAFTSDAGKPEQWCRKWLTGDGGDGMFARFWEQVLGWSLRPTESGKLLLTSEVRDGKIRVVIEARREDGKPHSGLKLEGGLTPPSGKGGEPGQKKPLVFVEKNSGVYEAEVRADEAGSYFLAVQAIRKRKTKGPDGREIEVEDRDGVRAGVTLPYSPEFGDLETNTALLRRLVEITNEDDAEGRVYEDDAEALAEAAKGDVFRAPRTRSRSSLPFHYWLLFFAAGLLLLDVAVRRLAFDARELRENAAYAWARLRGQPIAPPASRTTTVERLASKTGGARRYEGVAGAVVPKPVVTKAGGGRVPEAKKEAEPEVDTLDALKRAKKQVWEDKKEGGG